MEFYMNNFNQTVGVQADTDLGLKSFMLGTYRYMAMAMAVTGVVAYMFSNFLSANLQVLSMLFGNIFIALGAFAVIMIGFGTVGRKLPSMSYGAMLTFLFAMAAFLGVLAAPSVLFTTPVVLAKIFFMTVAVFAGLSLFGYTTQFNLWSIAKFAIPAFIGIVFLGILGMAIPALQFTGPLEIGMLLVMLVLLAVIISWETQALKQVYYGSSNNPAMLEKLSVYGAASLLLSFYNLFQILLSLFGRE